MSEENTVGNEDFSDAQTLDIGGDEVSAAELKIAELSKKIVDLGKQKQDLVDGNKGLNAEVELLKRLIEKSGADEEDLKRQIENLESEIRTLQVVAARAAELESEASRLQHDLESAMSDVQKLNHEVSVRKNNVEAQESTEKSFSAQLNAGKKERDLLIGKLSASEAKGLELQQQFNILDKKFQDKKGLDVEGGLAEAKRLEKELLDKIEFLEGKLKDAERKQQLARDGIPNGESTIIREEYGESTVKKGSGGLNMDLKLVVASTVGAVGVAGLLCYLHLHATKKL